MREIKFRAFEKKTNQVVFLTSNAFKELMLNDCFEKLSKDYEIMQFTGLHDKNGKEIWEGDVVRFRAMDNVPYRKAQIRILGSGTSANALEAKIDTTDGYIYPLSNNREFPIKQSEVIGNVYENPELLKS